MANIKIDFSKEQGRIKPVHGVGQPPFVGMNFDMLQYLTDANIPYSRLHDVGGLYGGFRFVDIPNIFRNFDADENDPASYDFSFTDILITKLVEANVEPYFRLGVTIENYHSVNAYRVFPPEDFGKWARVCEHVIRHYTEGWADGFNYKITYWEIWNEPDQPGDADDHTKNPMWRGTPEQFYELYTVTAKHLKACFPSIKVGGYGHCGLRAKSEYWMNYEGGKHNWKYLYFIEFLEGFLTYIKRTGAPLDFFSWHTYEHELRDLPTYARYARSVLDEYGYTDTEISCNEWNIKVDARGTFEHCSLNAATLVIFSNERVDNAEFYDARCGISKYGSLFDPMSNKPYPTYYAFRAFGRLYSLGKRVEAVSDNEALYVLAARGEGRGEVFIVNPTEESVPLEISSNGKEFVALLTGDGREDGVIPNAKEIPPFSVLSIMYTL